MHSIDPLQVMLDMQRHLQIRLANDKPETNRHPDSLETAGEVLAWLRNQDIISQQNSQRAIYFFGGMSNGKKKLLLYGNLGRNVILKCNPKINLEDLSPKDQLEIKFELIDQFHFFMNKFIALGMSAEEIFKLYYLKNAKNFTHQDQGY